MTSLKKLGIWGEALAKKYLLSKGYLFIAQNHREGRNEIDLIFKKGLEYIFIEVKTRMNNDENFEENPLGFKQTRNLKIALTTFCLKRHIYLELARLDLIHILVNPQTRAVELKHFKDIL